MERCKKTGILSIPLTTMKIVNFFFLISLFFTFNSLSDETTSWELLKEGGKVVFIRHAYAPGGGDPKNFDLYDCSTQRLSLIHISEPTRHA